MHGCCTDIPIYPSIDRIILHPCYTVSLARLDTVSFAFGWGKAKKQFGYAKLDA